MATNNKKNELDVTYGSNLTPNTNITPTAQTMAVQAAQNNTPNIDTTYQTNSKALYGGHDASWWQNQYNNSADDNSKQMIRKAADYYGYQIPEAVSPAGAPIPANNQVAASAKNLNYASNINNVQPMAISAASNSPTTEPTQDTVSSNVDSYEEFLRKRGETIKENYEKTNESIEQQRQAATQQAEADRQRSVIDARSSYEQNKATYGTNAEALAEMGLSGSGYSDYINAQAYATQRAEVQAANSQAENIKNAAEQQASANKLNNELTYQENLAQNEADIAQYKQQKEEQQKAAYAELLSYANNGAYTTEQLQELGKQYGLSDDQLSTLTAKQQEYNYNNYLTDIENGYTDTDTVEDAYEKGDLTTEQYESVKKKWNDNIDTSSAFFTYNGGYLTKAEAKKALDNVIKNEWCSAETKKALQDSYNELYSVKTNDVKFNNNGGWWIFGSTDFGDGDNFSVKDSSGFKYRIQSGGKVSADNFVYNVASDIGSDVVFGYQGKIYYKKNDNIYLIEKRDNSYGDHYDKLYKKFFG